MNEPAFPFVIQANNDNGAVVGYGMTLRDYFAAKAMQAYISDLDFQHNMTKKDYAEAAYKVADAMLKARQQ
jgi:hypothetical protein